MVGNCAGSKPFETTAKCSGGRSAYWQRNAAAMRSVTSTTRSADRNALEQAKGNYTEAAKVLGIHPNNLHRIIRTLDLKAAVAR